MGSTEVWKMCVRGGAEWEVIIYSGHSLGGFSNRNMFLLQRVSCFFMSYTHIHWAGDSVDKFCLSPCIFLPRLRWLITISRSQRKKTPFYLWSLHVDTICSVSLLMPCKMTAPSPLFHCQITVQGVEGMEAHKAENTKSHSANTLSGDSLYSGSLGNPLQQKYQGLSYSSGSASLLEKLFYWVCIEVNKENAGESIRAGMTRKRVA